MTQTEALRLALEALEYEAQKGNDNAYQFEREAIKAALANEALERKAENARELGLDYEPLEAKDEPWEKFCDSNCVWTDHHPDCKLAQCTWVGLTDEERESIVKEYQSRLATALIIEAKLKEKNT